jgi:hypothetical protein
MHGTVKEKGGKSKNRAFTKIILAFSGRLG